MSTCNCYVEDEVLASVEAEREEFVGRMVTPVWLLQIGAAAFGTVVLAAITADWEHLDLAINGRSRISDREWYGTRPLFDRGGLLPKAPTEPAAPAPPTFRPDLVERFLYSFGNLPVVVGRNELLLMLSGVATLQDMFLLPLLYDENGIDPKGGLKRLSQRLTPDQQALLMTMPPLRYELEALIDASYWLARTFLTRARALATHLDAEYPTAFEQATIRHVERAIGAPLGI